MIYPFYLIYLHLDLQQIQMMMFYAKTPPKMHIKQDQIQPWNADQPNMMNIILESTQAHHNHLKKPILNLPQQDKKDLHKQLKEGHSYNFFTNLRKYEKQKAEDFLSKKDVNFIQRNIKGISLEISNYRQTSPHALVSRMIQDKHEKSKMLHNQYSSTIQPINWSLITQFQEKRSEKRHRRKALQNFMRFQSQNHDDGPFKQLNNEETIDFGGQVGVDKYQKILKLREGLRRRNLKSSEQSRQKLENTLCVEQISKSSKFANSKKIGSVQTPKTSHSTRKKSSTIKIDHSNEGDQFPSNFWTRTGENKLFASHQNRIKLPIKVNLKGF